MTASENTKCAQINLLCSEIANETSDFRGGGKGKQNDSFPLGWLEAMAAQHWTSCVTDWWMMKWVILMVILKKKKTKSPILGSSYLQSLYA